MCKCSLNGNVGNMRLEQQRFAEFTDMLLYWKEGKNTYVFLFHSLKVN